MALRGNTGVHKPSRLVRPWLAGVALVHLWGCFGSATARIDPTVIVDEHLVDDAGTSTMATVLSDTAVAAGAEVTAFCYERSGAQLALPTAAVVVTVVPSPTTIVQGAGSATFVVDGAGTYSVFCRTADGSAADLAGARLEVRPGAPFSWFVDFLERDCYSQSLGLPLDVVVYDAFGNTITNAPVELATIPPTPVVVDSLRRFRIAQEGRYDITLTVRAPVAPGSEIEPFVASVVVDSTPPTVILTSPTRGAMLQEGSMSDSSVAVVGVATDVASTIVALSIDDVPVTVSGASRTASFAQVQTSHWGMNTISGRSEDSCGNVGALSQAYLRSPSYYAAAIGASAQAHVPSGAVLQLGQSVVDDGDRNDVDDLTTVANRALAQLDLDAMLNPGQVISYDLLAACDGGCMLTSTTWNDVGYTAYRDPHVARRITWQAPTLSNVTVVNGGLQLTAHIANVRVPLFIHAADRECALGCETTHGWYDIEAWAGFDSVDAAVTLAVNYTSGQAEVSVRDLSINLQGAYLDMDCGIVSGLCDLASNIIIDTLSSNITGRVDGIVRADVRTSVQSVLRNATLARDIVAPAPLGTTLHVDAGIDTVAFCGPEVGLGRPAACTSATSSAYGLLGIYTQIYPSARASTIAAEARGAIRKDGNLPGIDTTTVALGAGIKDDALNQLLWALWYGGGLDVDLTDTLGASSSAMSRLAISATLPPVVMPSADGNEIAIGVGDVLIDATLDLAALLGTCAEAAPCRITAYLSTILRGSIEVDPTNATLIVNVAPETQTGVQLLTLDGEAGAYQGPVSDLLARVLADQLPTVLESAIGAMPLPAMGIGNIAGTPAGTYWGLGNTDIGRTGDYLVLTGTLVSEVGTSSWPWPMAAGN